jgi:hypothetical protein
LWAASARARELPADDATMPKSDVEEILASNDFPETTSYTQKIDYITFSANDWSFTRGIITLRPVKPRPHDAKRLVAVGAEPCSKAGTDFITTVESKNAMGGPAWPSAALLSWR